MSALSVHDRKDVLMESNEIKERIDRQRTFFHTGTTLEVSFRIAALKRLRLMLYRHEKEIEAALLLDLKKSSFESYMCETGLVLDEIGYMLRHIRSFAGEKNRKTPLAQFCSRSYQKPSPYGVTLIISPWNYPVLLALDPLVDAIAAGNTIILKPSAYSPACSSLLARLISQYFPAKYITVVTGGRAENTALLQQHFDYIFFTGSKAVGREVMQKAAMHLTPVTLELGGKSPCLVDDSADLSLAARRIVFGKFLNCGQTCVAPDFIYCDEKRKEALITELKHQITKQFGKEPLKNPAYGKVINKKHFDRIQNLMLPEKVIFGGQTDPAALQIAPTLLDDVTFDDAIMQEEIFGPLLPIVTYRTLKEAVEKINSMDCPLALYLFSQNKSHIQYVTSRCSFGGGCINDTIIHLATPYMGFGGCNESGMGSYHGKEGFDTFTHTKSIVDKKTWIDLPIRYQPYTLLKKRLLKIFLGFFA